MSVPLPDFIIAGTAQEVSRWTDLARGAGILWCYEHERQHRPQCGHCIKPGHCGVFANSCLWKVMPVTAVSEFNGDSFEELMLITPVKKTVSCSPVVAKDTVSRLLALLEDTGVSCYESVTRNGTSRWQPVNEQA